jgi:hypothetical protein
VKNVKKKMNKKKLEILLEEFKEMNEKNYRFATIETMIEVLEAILEE